MAERRYLNFPIAVIEDISAAKVTYETFLGPHNIFDGIMAYAVSEYANGNGCSIRAAAGYLGLKIVNAEDVQSEANEFIERYNCNVFTSLETSIAYDFQNHKKKEFDFVVLAAHLACHSIVGKHPYSRVTKDLILSRMSGAAGLIEKTEYPYNVGKLDGPNGRRRWNKVLKTTCDIYGLKIYVPRGGRGYYMSYLLDSETLATNVERMIAGKKARKAAKKTNAELREIALQNLAAEAANCTP